MYLKYFALLLTACSSISATSRSQYEYEAVESTEVLQHEFYNMSSGLFYGYNATCDCYADFWWNSANCITTLADLTAIDRSAAELTFPIFGNTYIRAQKYNLMQQKMGSPSLSYHDHCIWPWHWTCPYGQPKPIIPGGFINDYWDDAGWWALGWIAVYDNTHDKRYLDTAVDIFDHMAFEGYNATCGAVRAPTLRRTCNDFSNVYLRCGGTRNISSRTQLRTSFS